MHLFLPTLPSPICLFCSFQSKFYPSFVKFTSEFFLGCDAIVFLILFLDWPLVIGHCYCTEMQLMFVCLLILYSAVFLLAQIVFLWFLEFFAYKNSDRFTSFEI